MGRKNGNRLLAIGLSAVLWAGGTAAIAVQLRDGRVYFVQPPSLLKTTTTQSGTRVWGATYYFTLRVPETAGEPLQQVAIAQREGADTIRYDLDETFAFVQSEAQPRTQIPVGEVTADRKARTVTVNFDPPVAPGQTVTIGLRPVRNPGVSGVYLFGVTAFPAGEAAYGQFLGYGRLHFYNSFDAGLWRRGGWWP